MCFSSSLISPVSVKTLNVQEEDTDDFVLVHEIKETFVVENGLIKVEFDKHGRICSYIDLIHNRSIIESGSLANVFKFCMLKMI